jgi:hypothetical protein
MKSTACYRCYIFHNSNSLDVSGWVFLTLASNKSASLGSYPPRTRDSFVLAIVSLSQESDESSYSSNVSKWKRTSSRSFSFRWKFTNQMELTKTSLLVNFAPANLQLHYPHRRSTAEGLVLSLYCYHSRVSLKLILKICPSLSAVFLLETSHSIWNSSSKCCVFSCHFHV